MNVKRGVAIAHMGSTSIATVERTILGPEGGVAVSIDEPPGGRIAVAILCPDRLDHRSGPHLTALGRAAADAGIVTARFDLLDVGGDGDADHLLHRYIGGIAAVRGHICSTYGNGDTIVAGHGIGGLASIVHAGLAAAEGVGTRAVIAINPPQCIGNVSAIETVASYPNDVALHLIAASADTPNQTARVLEIFRAAHKRTWQTNADIVHDYPTQPGQIEAVNYRIMSWLRVILDLGPVPRRAS